MVVWLGSRLYIDPEASYWHGQQKPRYFEGSGGPLTNYETGVLGSQRNINKRDGSKKENQ